MEYRFSESSSQGSHGSIVGDTNIFDVGARALLEYGDPRIRAPGRHDRGLGRIHHEASGPHHPIIAVAVHILRLCMKRDAVPKIVCFPRPERSVFENPCGKQTWRIRGDTSAWWCGLDTSEHVEIRPVRSFNDEYRVVIDRLIDGG